MGLFTNVYEAIYYYKIKSSNHQNKEIINQSEISEDEIRRVIIEVIHDFNNQEYEICDTEEKREGMFKREGEEYDVKNAYFEKIINNEEKTIFCVHRTKTWGFIDDMCFTFKTVPLPANMDEMWFEGKPRIKNEQSMNESEDGLQDILKDKEKYEEEEEEEENEEYLEQIDSNTSKTNQDNYKLIIVKAFSISRLGYGDFYQNSRNVGKIMNQVDKYFILVHLQINKI